MKNLAQHELQSITGGLGVLFVLKGNLLKLSIYKKKLTRNTQLKIFSSD